MIELCSEFLRSSFSLNELGLQCEHTVVALLQQLPFLRLETPLDEQLPECGFASSLAFCFREVQLLLEENNKIQNIPLTSCVSRQYFVCAPWPDFERTPGCYMPCTNNTLSITVCRYALLLPF